MNKFNSTAGYFLTEQHLLTEQQVFATMKAHCLVSEGYDYFTDEDLRMLAEGWKDWLGTAGQVTTDVLGFLDPTGLVDAAHAIVYFFNGQWILGTVTLLGAIPYVGDVFKILKYGTVGRALAKGTILSPGTLANVAPKLEKIAGSLRNIKPKVDNIITKMAENGFVKKFIKNKTGMDIVKGVSKIKEKVSSGIDKVTGWVYKNLQINKYKATEFVPDKPLPLAKPSGILGPDGKEIMISPSAKELLDRSLVVPRRDVSHRKLKGAATAAGVGIAGRGLSAGFDDDPSAEVPADQWNLD